MDVSAFCCKLLDRHDGGQGFEFPRLHSKNCGLQAKPLNPKVARVFVRLFTRGFLYTSNTPTWFLLESRFDRSSEPFWFLSRAKRCFTVFSVNGSELAVAVKRGQVDMGTMENLVHGQG